jgi:hypothetical protein
VIELIFQQHIASQADLLISVHPSIEEGIAKALDNIDTQRKLYVVEKSTQSLNEHQRHLRGFKMKIMW